MKTIKTDNANLNGKLLLRRQMLNRQFSGRRFSVFDCCQGEQVLWRILRREYDCQYMGVDVKPKEGRLKIDSRRLLQLNADKFDVIDIDTYGSPIRHLQALVPRIKKPVLVFVTYGQLRVGGGNYDHEIKRILGFDFELPNAIGVALTVRLFDEILAGLISPHAHIVECLEVPRSRNARYIGLILTPRIGKNK